MLGSLIRSAGLVSGGGTASADVAITRSPPGSKHRAGPVEQFRLLLARSWRQVNRAKFANATRVRASSWCLMGCACAPQVSRHTSNVDIRISGREIRHRQTERARERSDGRIDGSSGLSVEVEPSFAQPFILSKPYIDFSFLSTHPGGIPAFSMRVSVGTPFERGCTCRWVALSFPAPILQVVTGRTNAIDGSLWNEARLSPNRRHGAGANR